VSKPAKGVPSIGIRKLIGHISFWRLAQEIDKQRQKVIVYTEGLKDIQGIKPITEPVHTRATYPYLTLLFNDPLQRQKALRAFRKSGLGVSQIYTSAIKDYAYLKDMLKYENCPNGQYLAERQITLSTSTFLKNKDLVSVIETIKNLR